MTQKNTVDADDVRILAELMGIPFTVQVSSSLSEILNPNEFLAGLGIDYIERIKMVLSLLKGNLIPKVEGLEEALPKGGVIIPFTVTQGPFIKEEVVSIKAELTDDDGEKSILLTAILEEK